MQHAACMHACMRYKAFVKIGEAKEKGEEGKMEKLYKTTTATRDERRYRVPGTK